MGADYKIPVVRNTISLGTNVNFSGSYFVPPELNPYSGFQGIWVTFDAYAKYGPTDQRWEVAFIGKNLGDKLYAVDGSDVRVVTPGVPADTAVVTNRRRQLLLQFTIRPNMFR